MSQHLLLILFLFALGACIGSFLNVVVWRLPRNESLVSPPSHCPKCNTRLAWFDNIPVFGWIMLRGKCRYCREPISPRYPILEAITGLLFVFYYLMFFIWQIGPCAPRVSEYWVDENGLRVPLVGSLIFQLHWPIFALDLFLIACLLAASLIDAELFIIPIEIPWLAAVVGIAVHTFADRPTVPGALNADPLPAAFAAGGAIGLIVSIILFRLKLIQQSFPRGEPLLEIDREQIREEIELAKKEGRASDVDESELPPPYTRWQIRLEIGKEMLFLMPPLIGAGAMAMAFQLSPAFARSWSAFVGHDWASGLLGAILGALVGGFTVWITRILGTLFFGRVAMGLGDVHLMLGVGAVVGAGASVVAFFLAPFFGILIAAWMWLGSKRRELPYGPYLSLATALVLLCYCPIAAYLSPGLSGLVVVVHNLISGGAPIQ